MNESKIFEMNNIPPQETNEKQDNLKELCSRLEQDLLKIDSNTEGTDKIDPSYVKEIALNIKIAVEKIRDKNLSPEIKDALGRVDYILKNQETMPTDNMSLELTKTISSLQEELQKNSETNDETENKKIEIINKIIEGVNKEFDATNPEKNHQIGMTSIAKKIFIDISKIQNFNISDNLRGILGRGLYLEEKSENISKSDVGIELHKTIEEIKKELN